MSHEQLRLARTDREVLISNLRGEVGSAITTWILLRHFMSQAARLRSPDPRDDLGKRDLSVLDILVQKLKDELIAQMAELGEEKIGRTNFYFATQKLKCHIQEALGFSKFIVAHKFRRKRNMEIAHREQPEKWFEDRPIRISYGTIVKALGLATRLMKKLDRVVLGPAAPYLWHEARKKRKQGVLLAPARATYLLLPHYRLSPETRVRIAALEEAEGKIIWSEMRTTVNGKPTSVLVNKEWGLLLIGRKCLALPEYPFQKLESIQYDQEADHASDA